ncbi:hypothetical protein VAE122_3020042 [Vibrio aestuarianus]|nr:hypothetical protein VAE122_3020042 [Vibrio aestuarianus]
MKSNTENDFTFTEYKKGCPHMGQPFYLEFNSVSSTHLSLSLF